MKFSIDDMRNLFNLTNSDKTNQFNKNWNHRILESLDIVVGRIDNSPGCFSFQYGIDDEIWCIAYHKHFTPKELCNTYKSGWVVSPGVVFQSDPVHKYLYLDLIKFMESKNIEW